MFNPVLIFGDWHGEHRTFEALAASIKEFRRNHLNGKVIFTGDFVGQFLLASQTKDAFTVEALLMLLQDGDMMTLGNHDFNHGHQDRGDQWLIDTLLKLTKKNIHVVASNITVKNNKSAAITAFCHPMWREDNTAYIGAITPETNKTSNPQHVSINDLTSTRHNIIAQINEAKLYGAKEIVIVSHLGIQADLKLATYLSDMFSDQPMLIASGHSHDALVEPIKINNVTIAHAGWRGANVVTVIDGEYKLSKTEGKDKEAAALVEKYRAVVQAKFPGVDLQAPLFQLAGIIVNDEKQKNASHIMPNPDGGTFEMALTLYGIESDQARDGDTLLTRIAADAMQTWGKTHNTDFALFIGGGLRGTEKDEPTGISTEDLVEHFPFPQTLATVQITGHDLQRALEWAVWSDNIQDNTAFMTGSEGFTYHCSPGKEAGKRISNVKLNGHILLPNKIYNAAINDFMAKTFFKHFEPKITEDLQLFAITKHCQTVYKPDTALHEQAHVRVHSNRTRADAVENMQKNPRGKCVRPDSIRPIPQPVLAKGVATDQFNTSSSDAAPNISVPAGTLPPPS